MRMTREESTADGCDVIEERCSRPERSARWTLSMACRGVSVTYSSVKAGGMEGDYATWREDATARITDVFAQLES